MDFDQAIGQSYREASDAEGFARCLVARIEPKSFLPTRKYGNPLNFRVIHKKLTHAKLITCHHTLLVLPAVYRLMGNGKSHLSRIRRASRPAPGNDLVGEVQHHLSHFHETNMGGLQSAGLPAT